MTVLRSERGGISAEYVALLAVVVAIIAAIPYADIGAAVRDEVEEPICSIATDRDLEGGCGRDGGRSDNAGRDVGVNSPPTGEPSRGLGPIIARRAAVPVAQTVTRTPASSRGGREGATLLPVAAVRPAVRPAWVGPTFKVLQQLGKGIGKGIGRLFGKGRKPPAARPTPPSTIGQGLRNVRSIRSGRLAGYMRGDSELRRELQGARDFFRRQTGRNPTGAFDRQVVSGREVVFRATSGSGSPKIEVVDHGRRFLEKVTFLP